MSARCSQCGKPSMYQMEGGHLLCLNCYERAMHLKVQQFGQLSAVLNMLADQMELITGIPAARMHLPEQSIHYNPVNIQIDRSVVGAVNTGQIQQLDVAVTRFQEAGNTDLSEALREFTQAVVSDHEMEKETRDQILEQLSFLTVHTVAQPEQKKPSVAMAVLGNLTQVISTIPGLLSLWEKLRPLFEAALS